MATLAQGSSYSFIAPTAGAWVFGLNTANRGTAGNKVTVKIGRPTIRPAA